MPATIEKLPHKQREKFLKKFAQTRPETREELHDWVFYIGGVYIPRTKVCANHVAPFDAFCSVYFDEAPGTIVKGSRGLAGKTFFDAVLAWTLAVTKGAQITVLGGSEQQSKNVQAYLSNTHARSRGTLFANRYAPRHLLAEQPTQTKMRLKNGGEVTALTASQNSVRGPHPQILILDEIDEMAWAIFEAALGQPMSFAGIPAHVLATSTHQHPEGTYSSAEQHAYEKDWNVMEWCLEETSAHDGWLTQEMKREKKSQMTDERWRIEVELQEPSMEGRIFEEDTLSELFDPSLGIFDGTANEEILLVPPRYLPEDDPLPVRFPRGHLSNPHFSHGVDWGNRKDFTVVHSVQHRVAEPHILAAWGRWRRGSYHAMADRANVRVKRYGGACMIDGTGLGTVMEEEMNVPYEAHEFSARKATMEMYNNWVKAIQNGEYRYPQIKRLRRALRYLTTEMLYYDKHTPDEVVAAALQHKAMEEAMWAPLIGR